MYLGAILKSPQRLQHIAMLPICLHQFAKKTPVVVMQCIVMKLSAIASGRDRVVSTSSYVRLCDATGASKGRQ